MGRAFRHCRAQTGYSVTIALTGASGFVGQHVLEELLLRGQTVVATYRHGREPERKSPNLRWVEFDVSEPPLNAYDWLGQPKVLIHLAWAGLPHYDSLHHIEQELPNQYRFLSKIIRQGLPALVATGTCLEYGMQSGPLHADVSMYPTTSYGFAKHALFSQLKLLRAVHPFALTWARMFYIYGDGQPATSLLSQLRCAVTEGHCEFPLSGGEQLRDYLPVTEVAKQLVAHALVCQDRGAVNVCSGVPISVRRLVENWIKENRWNITLSLGQLPYPDYEPMAFWGVPDVDR